MRGSIPSSSLRGCAPSGPVFKGAFEVARYVTNTDLFRGLHETGARFTSGYASGQRLTDSTFEMGVIAVSTECVAVLWVTDED